jgi:hypothetical protein
VSTPPNIIQTQAEALLRRLAREQESRCRRALDAAQEQAEAIVSRAWQDARVRVRQAVAEERGSVEKALAERQAEIDTRRMQSDQRAVRETIDRAWSRLKEAMTARWEQAESRRQWCQAASTLARESIISKAPPIIEYDPLLTAGPAASAALLEDCDAPGGQLREVAGLGPGLRIRVGRACVDASLDGLLASRESIEAGLLAEIDRQVAHARSSQ